jgi:D-alanyl-D-alanine carboxypeptidase (penicillin-binding protein 5/6)
LLIIESEKLDMDNEFLIIDEQIEGTSGTSAELLEGDKYTFRQICYGLMLPSGNDAALAMAKWGGSKLAKSDSESHLKIFMKYVNVTCTSIGMKASYFGNPHGLPHVKSGTTV